MRGSALRHNALSAALVSQGFIVWRLRALHGLPWSLCRGNLDDNLRELESCDSPPDEEVANKVYRLRRLGYSREMIKEGLRLLSNSSFSSVMTEEGHVFASALTKQHRQYIEETVRARALVASSHCLVAPTVSDQRVKTLRQKLARLDREKPQYLTGRQAYVKDMIAVGSHWKRIGKRVGADFSKKVIKHHIDDWNKMDARTKRHFDLRALEEQQRKQEGIGHRRSELRAQLQVVTTRVIEQRAGLPPLRMSSARLTEGQKKQLDALYDGPTISHEKAAALRDECMTPIKPPSLEMQRVLDTMSIPRPPVRALRPWWHKTVTQHRSFFGNCMFSFTGVDGTVAYGKFVFARQHGPDMARSVLPPSPTVDPSGFWQTEVSMWDHAFQLDLDSWSFTDEVASADDIRVHVLSDALILQGGLCVSDASWMTMDEVQGILSVNEVAPVAEEEVDEEPPAPPLHWWAELPWLMEHLDGGFSDVKEKGGGESNKKAGGRAEEGDEEADSCDGGVNVEQAFSVLYDRRYYWEHAAPSRECRDFRWALRGGAWTAKMVGKAFDSFRGFAAGGEPSKRCAKFGLTPSATVSIKMYEEEGAFKLVQLWCHKMQWLYDRCLETTGDVHYTDDLLLMFVEPDEAQCVLTYCPAACATRLRQIRAMRPRS